ncbi:F-box protein At5g49610-like [Apium graveolens]|uniref:F-box protein At5g49610-like n=1 Tax=Apium graveolens TaxID=4045 RepID=UPI003D7A9E52
MMQNGAPSSNADHTTTFNDLPAAMLVNIFTRLPVKTLIRSTSVCKTWYSNITKPTFISAHIQHSLSCSNQNAVLFVPNNIMRHKYCSLVSADTGNVLEKYKIPFKTKNGSLQLCGCLNGLLCLNAIEEDPNVDVEYQDLYLWNPRVRKYRSLFSSCFKKRGFCLYALGMGVYEPTFDTRIVRIVYPADDGGYACRKVPPKAEIYSLKRNTWRRIKDPGVPLLGYHSGITVGNNMVYWLNTRMSRDFNEQAWLLSFDFNTEMFGSIKLPDEVRYCLGVKANFNLLKFEGKLAVFVLNERKETNGTISQPCGIWLMSHEEGKISWNLIFKIVLKEHMWPLNVSRGGTLLQVSYASSNRSLFFCNLVSEDLQQSKPLVTEPGGFVEAHFMESLLLLEGKDELLKSAVSCSGYF